MMPKVVRVARLHVGQSKDVGLSWWSVRMVTKGQATAASRRQIWPRHAKRSSAKRPKFWGLQRSCFSAFPTRAWKTALHLGKNWYDRFARIGRERLSLLIRTTATSATVT